MDHNIWIMSTFPKNQSSTMSSGLGKRQLRIVHIHGVQRPAIISTDMSQDKVYITDKDLGLRDKDDVWFVALCEVFEVENVSPEAFQVPCHSCER